MTFDPTGLRAVVFDYGSTLIQFGERQIAACDRALHDALQAIYGAVPAEKVKEIRDLDRRAPYGGDFLENDMAAMTANLVRNLYGIEPSPADLDRLLRVRYASFVEQVEVEDYVPELLEALSRDFKLGLLSNYPDVPALLDSVRKIGLYDFFDAIVVSGEVGRVKPHALPFRTILDRLALEPPEVIYVGDNWLGDIQGSKRLGMRAAHIVQWDTPEVFEPQPGDHEPDLIVHHLTDLLRYLKRDACAR